MSTALYCSNVSHKELEIYLALLEIDSVGKTHVAYGEYDLVAN